MKPWRLVIPQSMYSRLHAHLFPGDNDEHGAVIYAGIATSKTGIRLLARELHLAKDDVDYVPGKRGYRMIKANFIGPHISRCAKEGMAYLAVHNHGGRDWVAFSGDDLRSHERGYPALLDIAKGQPVGALVFADNAIAGDICFPASTALSYPAHRWLVQPCCDSRRRQEIDRSVETRCTIAKRAFLEMRARTFSQRSKSALSELAGPDPCSPNILVAWASAISRAALSNLPRLIAACGPGPVAFLLSP